MTLDTIESMGLTLGTALANTTGHGWFLPRDAALHGPALDGQLLLNLWIVLGLAALAHLLLLGGLIARRRGRAGSALWLEYLPLIALTALFSWLALRSQQLWAAQRYVGADPAAMQVEVTGEQFAWYFRYPGPDASFGQTKLSLVSAGAGNPLGLDPQDDKGNDDVVASQLVLPAGREVDLTLRALDVIHGFAVPEMRLKQNAVPGLTSHIHFTPTSPGEYAVLCTQICGLGHYRMQAVVRVVPVAEFDAWLRARESQREVRR
jgi:cytochrome c oxidase subunit 2